MKPANPHPILDTTQGQRALSLPSGLLFDMDGTLTRPMLDFPRIKQEMGIGQKPILEALAEMGAEARQTAEAVLLRHEQIAAEESVLNAGCEQLLGWMRQRGMAGALITRNSRRSVETVLRRHGLEMEVCVTREDAPFKPDPAPLFLACERLKMSPAMVWMIGDGQYDVEAGLAAGVKTVWVSHGRARPFAAEPWMTVKDLCELAELLQRLA